MNGFREEEALAQEYDAWMSVKLPRFMNREVMVAFSPRAQLACFNRWGKECIVITWEEFVACAKGVADVRAPVEQASRMREALWFFAARQRINIDD